ncbi:MAG: alanine--tRNA ligase, partial [Nitrospinota bacterium]
MTGNEVRKSFLEYFSEKSHRVVRSSSLVPKGDPTLLFTNAGMVQFKGVFTGAERRDFPRAASSQKCMRVSGKHNDLEVVGRTPRHHTFFEMLGNFSFGDYFKEKAIEYGWEFLVERCGLPAERIWVTVFTDDDEAFRLWNELVRIPAERIVRKGEKDNFWAMGDEGPCGPCSELVLDQGPHIQGGPPGSPEEEGDRYLELWNLVFMQYERSRDGSMKPLPKPSIDTGLGLERLAAVLQGFESNYHTDLLLPIIRFVEERAERPYGSLEGKGEEGDFSFRVIADHARAICFLVGDGVLPSNEGRGYVLRRIARRAMRHGRLLGIAEPFLHEAAGVVAGIMAEPYPELKDSISYISKVILHEEERFAHALDQAQPRMDDLCRELLAKGKKEIPGREVFRLYDTYGYPLDLALDTAATFGLEVEQEGFEYSMAEQRERARAHWKGTGEEGVLPLHRELAEKFQLGEGAFVGYESLEAEARVLAILEDGKCREEALAGEEVEVVLDRTPFYAEAGGQVGDRGILSGEEFMAEVLDTQGPLPGLHLHRCRISRGTLRVGFSLKASVDSSLRQGTVLNHTATHILQYALRSVLGDHVKQAGSLVAPDRLRFDYTHFAPLSPRERERVEELVNERIRQNHSVTIQWMPIEDALALGAIAIFGEKYGERVRVVSIGDWSRELCGGTHALRTGDIGFFRIAHEGSVAAGMRRIEALTGGASWAFSQRERQELEAIARLTKAPPFQEAERVERILEHTRQLEREVRELKARLARGETADIISGAREVKGVKVLAARMDNLELRALRDLMDMVKAKL